MSLKFGPQGRSLQRTTEEPEGRRDGRMKSCPQVRPSLQLPSKQRTAARATPAALFHLYTNPVMSRQRVASTASLHHSTSTSCFTKLLLNLKLDTNRKTPRLKDPPALRSSTTLSLQTSLLHIYIQQQSNGG